MPRSKPRPKAAVSGRRLSVVSLLTLALACLASGLAPFAHEAADAGPSASASNVSAAPASPAGETLARVREGYGRLPLRFEPNVGQAEPGVDFVSRGEGYGLFLKGTEAVLALRHAAAESAAKSDAESVGGASDRTSVLRMRLVGARRAPEAAGVGQLPGRVNYLRGTNPAAWRTGVPAFSGVEYRGVYPGVDLVYYGNQRELEYDFRLAPGADARRIRLSFKGHSGMRVDASGDLLLSAAGGEVRQRKPYAYQETADGRRVEVAARYALKGRREVSFELGDYDRTRALVIDPVLAYSTYLGGGGSNDRAHGVAVDVAGNAYVTGETISTDFPTTAGAPQTTFGGPNYDAYVTKLNPAGTAIVYSTYLGGGSTEEGYDIAVDAAGSAYVVGRTISTDFPVTAGAFQPAFGGGNYPGGLGGDAFVSKLNPAGTALVYSTYLGGASTEYGYGVALDAAGNAYVAGSTGSDNFPLMRPLQPAMRGDRDGFVTKLDASGASLVYSTYFGGTAKFDSLNASGLDNAFDIAVDAEGRAHVVGETQTTDFPVTPNAFQQSFGGLGAYEGDAYVAKFSAAGDALVYSTYLGGSHGESGTAIALDAAGHAYVTGRTASVNFPVANAFQPALANVEAIHDAFVTKLSLDGSALVYSTYLGGGTHDSAYGIAVGAAGSAYVAGGTNSDFFPVRNAVQGTIGGPSSDAFVSKLSPSGAALVYSTFLGGSRGDSAFDVAVDGAGDAYVVGSTSFTFPTTEGALRRTRNGEGDGFVSKIHVGEDEVTHKIGGRVTGEDGSPLAGIEINIFGGARARTHTAADGTYSFEGLRSGVSYSLTAYTPCGSFTSTGDTVNNLSSDQTVDFAGRVTTFTVSGYVTNSADSTRRGGVLITLSGAEQATATTDANGEFSFPNLPGCRDYTVTPSAPGLFFTKPSRTYTYLSMNQPFTAFNAAPLADNKPPIISLYPQSAAHTAPETISLHADASDATGAVAKVDFYAGTTLIGTDSLTTNEAQLGAVDHHVNWNVTEPGTYAVTAVATDTAGATATSQTRTFTVGPQTQPTPVTHSIGGLVTLAGKPLEGVTVTLAGAQSATATTDASGAYSFAGLAAGGSYTVTPSRPGYQFQPFSRGFSSLSGDRTADFAAAAPQLTNYALASNGGVASASSTTTQQELPGMDFSPAGVINGDRRGLNWEHGGGWRDATNNTFPDWLQVEFDGTKAISAVDVFSLQDDYANPSEPTEALTFTKFGVSAFDVQYWDGSAWAAIPGASVVGNDKVWRRFVFQEVTTTKIRVFVRNALAGRSRLVEVEAWGIAVDAPPPPPPGGRINAALSANGGHAIASSMTTQAELPGMDFHPSSVINGDRKGLNWEHGGGWRDGTNNVFPDWLEVAFAGTTVLDEVSVFSLQDNYTSPAEPTEELAFTKYGVTAFEVQYWDGSQWLAVPGGTITNNSSVWRKVTFQPVTTTRIRVVVNAALAGRSRLVEVEAWGTQDGAIPPSTAPKANHAASSNGGVATASSTTTQAELPGLDFSPAGVINGDRKGLNWEHGGGWRDGTNNTYPDWVEVAFAGARKVEEVSVFSLQDNYTSPSEPTGTTTFTKYGVTSFEVQYWDGAAWVTVPGGVVTGNNRVWRKVTFPEVTTTKVRVVINNALGGRSRLVEVEAVGRVS